MFRVVPAAHAKPHAQQQIARDLEVDYENFLTNVRGPPDKYGLLTLGRPCVRCYSGPGLLCAAARFVSAKTLQQKGIYTYLVRIQN